VASSTAAKGTKTIQDRQGAPANTIKIDAKNEGAWGNNISVEIATDHLLTTTLASDTAATPTQAILTSVGGLEVGSDLHFSEGVNDEYARLIAVDIPNKTVIWSGALTNTYTAADATVESMEFKITVYHNGVEVESHPNLSMNDEVTFFCEKLVVSNYIAVTDLKAVDTDYQDLPAVTTPPEALASGADGLSDVVASDYQGVQASKSGVYAFDNVPDLFRFCCPNPLLTDVDPAAAYQSLVQSLLDYANNRVTVDYWMDVPFAKTVTQAKTFGELFESMRLEAFFPWPKLYHNGLPVYFPPSSLCLGACVLKDSQVGVHKNPGNEPLPLAIDLEYHVSVAEGETLNNAGINTLRRIPGRGIRLYGGRTRSAETRWRFIHVAELWMYLGRSIEQGTQDVIFEPNDELLWKSLKRRIGDLLATEHRRGAIKNNYQIIMDSSNNPQDQIALGLANIEVEYVPVGTVEKLVISLKSSPSGLSVVG
jgi:phage tail sheath protein FI